jgi:hypothetical protein
LGGSVSTLRLSCGCVALYVFPETWCLQLARNFRLLLVAARPICVRS